MREGRTTRRESIAITRYMVERGSRETVRSRWTGRSCEWIVSGRISVALRIKLLGGWMRRVNVEIRIRICKSTSQGVDKRMAVSTGIGMMARARVH